MGKTLIGFKQEYKLAQQISDLKQKVSELRANQSPKLVFVDVTVDGTGVQGIITIGKGTNAVYLQSRIGGGIDFFRFSDNKKIMSLDINGNLKCLGSITGNTNP